MYNHHPPPEIPILIGSHLLPSLPCPFPAIPQAHSQPLIYFLSLEIYFFWTFCINGILQYVAFCIWLSLSIMFSSFIYVVGLSALNSLSLDNIPVYRCFTFYLSIDRYLGDFHFLAFKIMILWPLVYKFLCGYMFLILLGIYLEVELLGHIVNCTF